MLPISFSIVQNSELWSSNSLVGVRFEDTVWSTSSLGYDKTGLETSCLEK